MKVVCYSGAMKAFAFAVFCMLPHWGRTGELFGAKFGDTVDASLIQVNDGGEFYMEYEPPANERQEGVQYRVFLTPKTKRIYTIRAARKGTPQEVSLAASILKDNFKIKMKCMPMSESDELSEYLYMRGDEIMTFKVAVIRLRKTSLLITDFIESNMMKEFEKEQAQLKGLPWDGEVEIDGYQGCRWQFKVANGEANIEGIAQYSDEKWQELMKDGLTIPAMLEGVPVKRFRLTNWHNKNMPVERVAISDGVVCIDDGAFAECTALKAVAIPSSVTNIGFGAFRNCARLEQISLPSGIREIASEMFYGCTQLKKVIVPDGVMEIGCGAFLNCLAMEEVYVPDGVEAIGDRAFQSCKALKKIKLPRNVKSIGFDAFNDCESLETIYVPKNYDRNALRITSLPDTTKVVVANNTIIVFLGSAAATIVVSVLVLLFVRLRKTKSGDVIKSK